MSDLDNDELKETRKLYKVEEVREFTDKLVEYEGIIIGLSLTLLLYMMFSIYLFCRLVRLV